MTPEQMRRRARILVAYTSRELVGKAARIPLTQVDVAMNSGRPSPYTTQQLCGLDFERLEQFAPLVGLKGTRLRLRALYAVGVSMDLLASWDSENRPKKLDRVRLSRYANDTMKREKIRTEYHQWVRKAYNNWSGDGVTSVRAREWAYRKGWHRPIELEEDLIDMPEPWAGQLLARRGYLLSRQDPRRIHRAMAAGERSELVLAAHKEWERWTAERYKKGRP